MPDICCPGPRRRAGGFGPKLKAAAALLSSAVAQTEREQELVTLLSQQQGAPLAAAVRAAGFRSRTAGKQALSLAETASSCSTREHLLSL